MDTAHVLTHRGTALDLSFTKGVDQTLKELAEDGQLTHVRKVSLACSDVTHVGLRRLAKAVQIEELNLSHTGTTDAGMKHLAGPTGAPRAQPLGHPGNERRNVPAQRAFVARGDRLEGDGGRRRSGESSEARPVPSFGEPHRDGRDRPRCTAASSGSAEGRRLLVGRGAGLLEVFERSQEPRASGRSDVVRLHDVAARRCDRFLSLASNGRTHSISQT